ncbi:MAG: restriction endonuclease subunit S [Rhodospirillaceae bacterium]|nr:restriction endonuclease subunit S [Rhodospirillaceae bacterium]
MKVATVRDISEQIRGVTYAKSDASAVPKSGYSPMLRANNIGEHGLLLDELIYVPNRKISPRQRIVPNDVVVAASSGSISVVGKTAQARQGFDGGFGAFCKVLRPGPSVDPHYFGHYFKTPSYRRVVSHLAAGANINNLRNEHLDNLRIPLPPLAEQKRIARILDAADALRATRREALAQLETLIQSAFLDMFGDPVTNPMGWKVVSVGDEISFLTSGSRGWAKYYAEDGDTFLRIQNLKDGQLDLGDIAFVNAPESAEARRTRVEPRDVLLSITADLGRTAVVPDCITKAHINQHLAILRFTNLSPVFVSYQLASKGGQAQFDRLNREGVKAGLNFNDVKSIRLTNPPLNLQHHFAAIAESVEQHKAAQRAHLTELDALFASLQSRAFQGDL